MDLFRYARAVDGTGEVAVEAFATANPQARCFYDVNLREGHWNLDLVQRLSRLASIIKLNETEAETLFELSNGATPFDGMLLEILVVDLRWRGNLHHSGRQRLLGLATRLSYELSGLSGLGG